MTLPTTSDLPFTLTSEFTAPTAEDAQLAAEDAATRDLSPTELSAYYAERSRQFSAALEERPAHRPSVPALLPEAATFTTSSAAPQAAAPSTAPRTPLIEARPPSYFIDFTLPPDAVLVGECHLTRGDIALVTGVPGCGKSRLLVSLAIAGKQGKGATWMGMPVHAPFKTLILQAENGAVRLKSEFGDILSQGHDLDGHLYITPPPPRGFAFHDIEFLSSLRELIERLRPGVIALDPWNRAVQDDKARDYREALDALESCLPEGLHKPAIVIVHHLRKSASGEARKTGRDLLNEISGSYVIGSACRSAFVLEPASPDPQDNRVVFTCAKNNNGSMGPSTAWHRQNGLFARCEEFDWKEWREGPGSDKRLAIELEDLAHVFENGEKMLSKSTLVKALRELTNASVSSVYLALKADGRFASHLSEAGGFYTFKP